MTDRTQTILGTLGGITLLGGIVALGIWAGITHPSRPFDQKEAEENLRKDLEKVAKDFPKKYKADLEAKQADLLRMLKSKSPADRATAAKDLPEVVSSLSFVTVGNLYPLPPPELVEALGDEEPSVRTAANDVFWELRLIEERVKAMDSSGNLTPETTLRWCIAHGNEKMREAAQRALHLSSPTPKP